jgi:hypothetical protein
MLNGRFWMGERKQVLIQENYLCFEKKVIDFIKYKNSDLHFHPSRENFQIRKIFSEYGFIP